MIPRTFPSSVASNGSAQMIVYFLPSVSGLTRWVDYIPVQYTTASTSTTENTYNQNGYIPVASLSSISGLTPFKEYVPVYLDNSATDVWKVNITGFIPVGIAGVGGIPYALFAAGEQGWVYDPSNLASLFQDAAGTTPVTAMEQPVGLQLDLKNGFPTLGAERTTNGTFETNITGWAVGNAGQSTLAWSGGKLRITRVNAGEVYPNARTTLTGLTVGRIYKIVSMTNNPFGIEAYHSIAGIALSTVRTTLADKTMECVFTATATSHNLDVGIWGASGSVGQYVEFDNISVRELPGNHRYQTTSANRPVVSARVNLLTATETLATQTVTTHATTQTLTFTGSGSITLSGTATGTYTAGTYSVTTTAGSLIVTVLGTVTQADLRASNMGVGLPAYQRVNTSTDYDTAGFPVYIKANGSNQFMVSNAIDFTATDKMTVWVGVRKLSDAAAGIVAELSLSTGSNSGSFLLAAPATGAPNYGLNSRGSVLPTTLSPSGYSAPITNVLTGIGDISGDLATLRVNGAQAATSSADQGTGNYGNHVAYHYARAGTSLFFNGHDYGSICRGAASSAAQIAAAEGWINSRTKAY